MPRLLNTQLSYAGASGRFVVVNTSESGVVYIPAGSLAVAEATKLTTARTIALAGDVSGNINFDGSANATFTAVLANTGVSPGTYTKIVVDAAGRVTAGLSSSGPRRSDVVRVTNTATVFYEFTELGVPLSLSTAPLVLVFVNRMLLRPSEYSISGERVVLAIPVAIDDEIEAITFK
jgi:hypothetical protein